MCLIPWFSVLLIVVQWGIILELRHRHRTALADYQTRLERAYRALDAARAAVVTESDADFTARLEAVMQDIERRHAWEATRHE